MLNEFIPTNFTDTTEQFTSEWADQLNTVPRCLIQLEMLDDGSLRQIQPQSANNPNAVIPKIITLETSLSESGGVVWHIGNNKTHTQYDVDTLGATELKMDLQGNLLAATETDEATHQEIMDLVVALLEHPVTIMKFAKLSQDAANPELKAMREKLEAKQAQLTSEENKVFQKLKLLGKLSVGSASKNNRTAIVSREVYTGRTGTLLTN